MKGTDVEDEGREGSGMDQVPSRASRRVVLPLTGVGGAEG